MNFLHPLETAVVLFGLLVLLLLFVGAGRRLTLAAALAAAAVAGVALARHGLRWEMTPAYALSALQLPWASVRWARRPRATHRRAAGFGAWLLRGAAALVSLLLLAYPLAVTPMLSSGYRHDLSQLGWTEAFERMHEELAAEYPFTDWKGIDWGARLERYGARVAESEARRDVDAYRLALREYVHSVPDGHVRLVSPDDRQRKGAVGGGFGLALAELHDGSVVVARTWPAAEAAGVSLGHEVLSWNGQPVAEALAATPTHWAERPAATNETRRIQQLRFLARAPVGAVAEVTLRAPGGSAYGVRLVAADDGEATLRHPAPHAFDTPDGPLFEAHLLEGGYGYMRLRAQRFPSDSGAKVQEALARFEEAGVKGVLFDLRGNRGGSDFTVPRVVAPFFAEPTLYHHVWQFNPRSGRFEPIPFNTYDPLILYISYRVEPVRPAYDGPLAVLVDHRTASSAEGIAMLLARLPNSMVIGTHATSGILGAGNVKRWLLPEGVQVRILDGRSLNAEGQVQVDSDASGVGGVRPGLRVPLTLGALRQEFQEGADVVLERALRWIDEASR